MKQPVPFIERFGLWTPEQKRQARALKALCAKHKLKLIRLVWSDTHGHARTKEVTIPAFLSALSGGYNPGGPGDIVVVRLSYEFPIAIKLWNPNLANMAGNNRLIIATAAFRNEPYN